MGVKIFEVATSLEVMEEPENLVERVLEEGRSSVKSGIPTAEF